MPISRSATTQLGLEIVRAWRPIGALRLLHFGALIAVPLALLSIGAEWLFVLPLVGGAAVEALRLWLRQRVRSALRQRCLADAARSALDQKLLAEERATGLEDEHCRQKEQTAKLQGSVGDLEGKIRQARQKRTLLVARLTRAEAGRRINATLDRVESRSAFAHFQRMEDRVERAEALNEACDRLEGRDPDAAELERKFAEDERQEKLRREFEELKTRLGEKSE